MSAAALHGLKPHGFKLRDRGVRLATGYIKAKHFLHVKRNSSCCGLKQFSQRQCKSVRKELLDSLYTSVFVMLAFRDMLSKHPLPYKAHVQSNAKNRITCTIWNLKKKIQLKFQCIHMPTSTAFTLSRFIWPTTNDLMLAHFCQTASMLFPETHFYPHFILLLCVLRQNRTVQNADGIIFRAGTLSSGAVLNGFTALGAINHSVHSTSCELSACICHRLIIVHLRLWGCYGYWSVGLMHRG